MPTHDSTEGTRAGFFAVGQQTFHAACALGINAASAFLVLARGTGADNMTTSWSAKAVRERIGVRSATAVSAIDQIVSNRLATKSGSKDRPKYKLRKDGVLIWLPNAIIDGVGAEKAPVARIRETQDVMVLRLLCDLYSAQNLAEDGGINPYVWQKKYSRRKVGQRGSWTVWQFAEKHQSIRWTEIMTPHATISEEKEYDGTILWNRLHLLERFGLVSWVPYIFDGPEGEPVFAYCPESAIDVERNVAIACAASIPYLLTGGQLEVADDKDGVLIPVRSHIEQAQLIGVPRLRYRPHTQMTAAWWALHSERCQAIVRDLAPYTGGMFDAEAA